MKIMKLTYCLLLASWLGISGLSAQENMNSCGGIFVSETGSVSNSIGQLVIQTQAGSNGSVSEGVHQAFEISQIVGINDIPAGKIEVSFFPNPVTVSLSITVDASELLEERLICTIRSAEGKFIEQRNIISKLTSIDMQKQAGGVYFLSIQSADKQTLNYKLIKN
ncbi:MAG: T9SS type A sorting domain-containing protein [Bacteroidales bacterium]|nr:T9SS type A sorting domain-containing protein [Bacteroidales bacterium]